MKLFVVSLFQMCLSGKSLKKQYKSKNEESIVMRRVKKFTIKLPKSSLGSMKHSFIPPDIKYNAHCSYTKLKN